MPLADDEPNTPCIRCAFQFRGAIGPWLDEDLVSTRSLNSSLLPRVRQGCFGSRQFLCRDPRWGFCVQIGQFSQWPFLPESCFQAKPIHFGRIACRNCRSHRRRPFKIHCRVLRRLSCNMPEWNQIQDKTREIICLRMRISYL